jgi:anthranilate synthase/aminodeoxychorismate synthase-like glutamine amidotransferase
MILLIDNYDSFVYNLARYVSELGNEPYVVRNDKVTIQQIETDIKPSHIIISPGPCGPEQAGISVEVIKKLGCRIPILGVCLGHQAIGYAYGAVIEPSPRPVHGKSSLIYHQQQQIFMGLANPLRVGRYHSLIVRAEKLPSELLITARTEEGVIMALQHQRYPVFGVQFHPESILTEQGYLLLKNFLEIK